MVYTLIIVDAIKLLYEGTKVMTPMEKQNGLTLIREYYASSFPNHYSSRL